MITLPTPLIKNYLARREGSGNDKVYPLKGDSAIADKSNSHILELFEAGLCEAQDLTKTIARYVPAHIKTLDDAVNAVPVATCVEPLPSPPPYVAPAKPASRKPASKKRKAPSSDDEDDAFINDDSEPEEPKVPDDDEDDDKMVLSSDDEDEVVADSDSDSDGASVHSVRQYKPSSREARMAARNANCA